MNAYIGRTRTDQPAKAANVASFLWLTTCLALGAWFIGAGIWPSSNAPAKSAVNVTPAKFGGVAENVRKTKRIEDIRVGDRVTGTNPIREEVDQVSINPETWRLVRLHMKKSDGCSVQMELLRSPEWVAAIGGNAGASIFLDLFEMGAVGYATVDEIVDCPSLDLKGEGTLVTGVFAHQASPDSKVLLLRLQGEEQATGVTSRHPFWSETRGAFVEAGELEIGELLNTSFGLRKVESVTTHPGYSDLLYTFETTEHVYRAGSLGTLVHNASVPRSVNPGTLRVPLEKSDDVVGTLDKLRSQIAQHGASRDWTSPLQGIQDRYGNIMIQNGVTRALRVNHFNRKWNLDIKVDINVTVDVTQDFRGLERISGFPSP